jgi:hypothetical protein
MARGILIPCLLLAAAAGARAQNQSIAESSIPEPTDLSVAALQTGVTLVWSQVVGQIQSTGANAVITAVELTSRDGQRIHGVTVSLSSADATDKLYLGGFELLRFRDELAELASVGLGTPCEAINSCVTGIARCRPSQTVLQAYCPWVYTTSTSEEGFGLSTPRHSFQFPSISPSKFIVAADSAIDALDGRSRDNVTVGNEAQQSHSPDDP